MDASRFVWNLIMHYQVYEFIYFLIIKAKRHKRHLHRSKIYKLTI